MEPEDCVFWPASTEGPCAGEVDEEWTEDVPGDPQPTNRCVAHSHYRMLDGLDYAARVAEAKKGG